MKIKILDCTLRDGGYYNNWDFDQKTVDQYLKSVSNSLVDVVEIGFRFLPKKAFYGPYAYSTDDYINQLNLPEYPIYGVMINAKEFVENGNNAKKLINEHFQRKSNSPISLVRVAIDFDNIFKTQTILNELKNLGYKVGLNMMQANNKSKNDYFEKTKMISSWDLVDVLYFADSLGNMTPSDVKNICDLIKDNWSGELGIHTHNNKNLALINSMTAIENGVSWCDSTITGMGRGAGNVSTESLLLEMSRLGYYKGNANMIQPSVEDFTILKNKHNWGSNLYYHYAANHGIHPTFVQSLLKDKRYDNHQVINALEFLSDRDSSNYSTDAVREAIYGDQNNSKGTWNATAWLKNMEVLIIGAGPSVKHYKSGILQYIKKSKSKVIFLNINNYLPTSIAKATIVCHATRALFDSLQYSKLDHPIIMPKGRLGTLLNEQIKNIKILDYGLTLNKNLFSIEETQCSLKWSLAAAYAFAVVTQAGASKISLVGFDGYSADDPRQEEMNDVFYNYSQLKRNLPIVSLTPTTYRIGRSSIFSPKK